MLLAASTLALLLSPQGRADEPVARFQLAGADAWVTADDLALELARRYHRSERGRTAVSRLVDLHLVRREAARRGLMPSPDEVRELGRVVAEQLRAAGQELDSYLADRHWSMAEFEDYLALGLAHKNLARDASGLPGDAEIGEDLMNLWLRQARGQAGVIEDPERLEEGYVAKVGTDLLSLLDLGRLLTTTSSVAEREQFIRQIIVLRCLETEAAARSVTVTESEARAEVQARAEAADRDARYGGLRFEQVLLTQGLTLELLARWPVLRAQIIERKLVDLEYGPEDLQRLLDENRADILKRYGPRRQLSFVFSRASEEPNELVPRDFATAEAELRDLRAQIAAGTLPFSTAAQRFSEDAMTRAQGGAAGWHRRGSPALPETVLEAAFALPRHGVSEPLRAEDGCYLVKVLDIEPVPEDAVLLESVHQELEVALRQRILEAAGMELL